MTRETEGMPVLNEEGNSSEALYAFFQEKLRDHYSVWHNVMTETMPLPYSQQPLEEVLQAMMEAWHAFLYRMFAYMEGNLIKLSCHDLHDHIETYFLGAVALSCLGIKAPGLEEEDEDGE
jgi:hypothetical protein